MINHGMEWDSKFWHNPICHCKYQERPQIWWSWTHTQALTFIRPHIHVHRIWYVTVRKGCLYTRQLEVLIYSAGFSDLSNGHSKLAPQRKPSHLRQLNELNWNQLAGHQERPGATRAGASKVKPLGWSKELLLLRILELSHSLLGLFWAIPKLLIGWAALPLGGTVLPRFGVYFLSNCFGISWKGSLCPKVGDHQVRTLPSDVLWPGVAYHVAPSQSHLEVVWGTQWCQDEQNWDVLHQKQLALEVPHWWYLLFSMFCQFPHHFFMLLDLVLVWTIFVLVPDETLEHWEKQGTARDPAATAEKMIWIFASAEPSLWGWSARHVWHTPGSSGSAHSQVPSLGGFACAMWWFSLCPGLGISLNVHQ